MADEFEIAVLGDTQVGKTCLIKRFVLAEFKLQAPTTGIKCFPENTTANNTQYKIWDTAGQEQFLAISTMFLETAAAFIICYDMTDRRTFDKLLDTWSKPLSEERPLNDFNVVLVACKSDLENERQVTKEEGLKKAVEIGERHGDKEVKFYEASAKTGANASFVFTEIAHACVRLTEEPSDACPCASCIIL